MDFKRIKERIAEILDGVENEAGMDKAKGKIFEIVDEISRSSTKVPIKYIGTRATHADMIYGTAAIWKQGYTVLVPKDAAQRMLANHPDVYAPGEAKEATSEVDEKPEVSDETEDAVADQVRAMVDIEQVRRFVSSNFSGAKLPPKIGLGKAKERAIQLIDQYGLV